MKLQWMRLGERHYENNSRKSFFLIRSVLAGIAFFSVISAIRAENLPYYVIQAGVLVEDFETIGDWAVGAGFGSLDTNFVKTGSGSLKIVTLPGFATTAIKTISLSGLSNGAGFWVYVVDDTKISYVTIYLSSQPNFSKYFMESSPPLHTGWNFVGIGKDNWANIGGESWDNTMVRLKMRTQSKSEQVGIVYYDSLYSGIYTRPKCIITFDDGYCDVYGNAYPCMKNHGFNGTNFIISSLIDMPSFMTLDNLTTLYNEGWDISNHTHSHYYLPCLTQEQQETEIEICSDYLYDKGFTRNDMHKSFAYPYGGYNAYTEIALAAQGILTARGTSQGYNFILYEFSNPYHLKAKTISKDTSPETVEGYIDTAIAEGEMVILVFHHIVEMPTVDTQWSTSNFGALMTYLESKKDQIDVVTRSEWYAGLAGLLNTPTVLTPVVNSPVSITWNWIDNSELEDSYRVHYEDNGEGTNNDINNLPAQATSWTDNNLSPNTRYSVHIHAYRADIGESPASDISIHIYTLASQVACFSAARSTSGYEINLSWTNQGQTGVKIEQDTNGDGFATTLYDSPVSTPALPFQVSAPPYSHYRFRISSYNGEGVLNTICIPNISSPSVLAAPTGLVSSVGNRMISLMWDHNDAPELTGYNVYRSTTSGGGYSKLNSFVLTSSDYNDGTIANGMTYYYVVVSVDNVSDESCFSNEVTGIWRYGDMLEDGIVDLNDLAEFFSYWQAEDCDDPIQLDLNSDCITNFYEFSQLALNWLVQ